MTSKLGQKSLSLSTQRPVYISKKRVSFHQEQIITVQVRSVFQDCKEQDKMLTAHNWQK